jgi:uncharacterized protein (DUF1330 family)
MAAYVLVDIKIDDPITYEEYKRMAPPSIEAFGGKYVVRGGRAETLEGNWAPARMVILQFESIEKAKAWWSSPEYAPAKALRHKSAKTEMMVVEGLDGV